MQISFVVHDSFEMKIFLKFWRKTWSSISGSYILCKYSGRFMFNIEYLGSTINEWINEWKKEYRTFDNIANMRWRYFHSPQTEPFIDVLSIDEQCCKPGGLFIFFQKYLIQLNCFQSKARMINNKSGTNGSNQRRLTFKLLRLWFLLIVSYELCLR